MGFGRVKRMPPFICEPIVEVSMGNDKEKEEKDKKEKKEKHEEHPPQGRPPEKDRKVG
jgi:hypothetical protein